MFGSLFSDRYNRKREMFYAQYEEIRQRFPNLPCYRRAAEPLSWKLPKRGPKKRKQADYDYDEWIGGNFVSIVVRRAVEQRSCSQLMEPAPRICNNVSSWRCWAEEETEEPRRSLRLLTDKPNLKPKDQQQDVNAALEQQQQQQRQQAPFIDGCCQRQCNMCGIHLGNFGDLQLHSLDDCRKYLLATLHN